MLWWVYVIVFLNFRVWCVGDCGRGYFVVYVVLFNSIILKLVESLVL